MQKLNSLQEFIGVNSKHKISDENVLKFVDDIKSCFTHNDIVQTIKKINYLEHKQKLALLKYFKDNELYTQSLFETRNLMRYVRQCLKYLPLTEDQRMETEYVFSQINQNRFKNNRQSE